MAPDVWSQIPSLGVCGVLFVMWWFERQDRLRSAAAEKQVRAQAADVAALNEHLLNVVRSNTEAMVALRDELRTLREMQMQILGRVERLQAA